MLYATLAAAAAALVAGVAYFDRASAALLACLLGYSLLCDWVAAGRHQSRRRWNAYRVMDAVAGRQDPGPWAGPVRPTPATGRGD